MRYEDVMKAVNRGKITKVGAKGADEVLAKITRELDIPHYKSSERRRSR